MNIQYTRIQLVQLSIILVLGQKKRTTTSQNSEHTEVLQVKQKHWPFQGAEEGQFWIDEHLAH